MQIVPPFDRLCVISDLHLGGAAGRQIFDQGPTLAGLIKDLAAEPPRTRVGLVINGDLVDFLAEPGAICFDPEGAISRLERIVGDTAFSPVFEALTAFVKKAGRQLILTLGNHDLELALPWVRERLLQILSGGNEAARSRITLAFEGAGYRCDVGSAPVLCLHGNEVDEWNVTDHEQIRRIGRDFVRDRTPEAWKPNAGARMVVEVMNDIKRDHPFVDLLKPEFQAAIPALLVIKPALAGKIADIGRVALRMTWDGIKMRFGFLSAAEANAVERMSPAAVAAAEPSQAAVLRQLLSSAGPGFASSSTGDAVAADLLDRAEQHMVQKRLPLELVGREVQATQLGLVDAAWQRITGGSESEVLRAALGSVQKDRSFEVDAPDATFRRVDELVGPGVRFVVAGHTHLRRAVPRTQGNGFYYNTGTWARLLHLTAEQLKSAADFAEVFKALKVPTLAELDRTPYVSRFPTAAFFETDGSATRGALRQYTLDGAGKLTFAVVPGSSYPPA